jgi:hypothetical protein
MDHVEQLFVEAAAALRNAERCEAESLEWYCKLGKMLLQGQEAHGVYGWTKLAAERMGRSDNELRSNRCRFVAHLKAASGDRN